MSRWTARRTVLANVARVVADIADAAAADELMDSSEPVTASDDVTDVCHTYDTGNNCSDTALCFEMSEHGEFSSGHSSTIDESNAGHDECAYTCNMSDAVPRVVGDFFKYPLKSSDIGINFVSDLSSKLFIGTLSDYECKNVALPHNSGYVVFPLVH